MNGTTRRRALESAARVALGCYLGAAATGCGGLSEEGKGAHASEPQPSGAAGTPASGPTPDPTGSTSTPTPIPTGSASAPTPVPTASAPTPVPTAPAPTFACIPPVEVANGALTTPVDSDQQACCESYVTAAVSAGQAPAPTGSGNDPSVLNCCRALAYVGHFAATVAHDTCCTQGLLAQDDFYQPYCSPWGPPMPPALVLA